MSMILIKINFIVNLFHRTRLEIFPIVVRVEVLIVEPEDIGA